MASTVTQLCHTIRDCIFLSDKKDRGRNGQTLYPEKLVSPFPPSRKWVFVDRVSLLEQSFRVRQPNSDQERNLEKSSVLCQSRIRLIRSLIYCVASGLNP
jgi:hypothetical protein